MSDSKGELWDSPTYTYTPFTATIMKALSNHDVAGSLIGIETYNAARIDKMSNHYVISFGEHLEIAKLGSKLHCQYIYPPYECSIIRRLIRK